MYLVYVDFSVALQLLIAPKRRKMNEFQSDPETAAASLSLLHNPTLLHIHQSMQTASLLYKRAKTKEK